jgi:aminobenzoyl-glutamate utilization protein A
VETVKVVKKNPKVVNINTNVDRLFPTLIEWRRDFHKHAESGWVEYRTASRVAVKLTELGYKVNAGKAVINKDSRMGVPEEAFLKEQEQRAINQGADPEWVAQFSDGFTGVIGLLETGRPGPTVAYRFDMDALEIQESAEEDHLPASEGFTSLNAGMMHACGHDAHTTIGLGVAEILMENLEHLSGRIKLIFQPAEEGVRGAKSMVDAGVLDDVDALFAFHIGTGPELGEVVCGANGFLATTKFDVSYKGVASHAGGFPEEGKNALLAAANAALNLHSIPRHSQGVSRVNVGVLQAGSGRNIIPGSAHLKVETRGETTEINRFIYHEAERIVKAAADMHGVEYEVALMGGAESSESCEKLFPFIRAQAEKVTGVHTVKDLSSMNGSEDATYMMEKVKSGGGVASYLIFGTTLAAGHHNEKFDIDERVMAITIKTLALLSVNVRDLTEGEPTHG